MNATRMTRQLWTHADRIFWLGVLLGLGFSWWYAINQVVDGDQTQMIHKGYLGVYQGIWSSFGNTASVVGNVPGSLLAWVVGAPLMVWDSPYAPMLFLILIRLVGFLLLDSVIRQVYPDSPLARLTFLLLCWLNPWFLFDSLLYNPAYLIFCVGLHCWTAWHMQHRSSFALTLLHVIAIGLAMQLHFSWPLLVFMSLMLWYRGMIKINGWGVLVALALIVASLLPYLLELQANPDLAHNPDPDAKNRYIGWGAVHVFPVLKAAIYWLRYASWSFPSKLINDTEFLWLGVQFVPAVLEQIWKITLGVIGGVTVVFAAIANWTAFAQIRGRLKRQSGAPNRVEWLLLYAMSGFIAALICAALAPLVFNYWHLTLIFPVALFPVVFWVMKYMQRSAMADARGLIIVAVFFMGINLVVLNDSRKYSYAVDYAQQTLDYVKTHIGPRVQ